MGNSLHLVIAATLIACCRPSRELHRDFNVRGQRTEDATHQPNTIQPIVQRHYVLNLLDERCALRVTEFTSGSGVVFRDHYWSHALEVAGSRSVMRYDTSRRDGGGGWTTTIVNTISASNWVDIFYPSSRALRCAPRNIVVGGYDSEGRRTASAAMVNASGMPIDIQIDLPFLRVSLAEHSWRWLSPEVSNCEQLPAHLVGHLSHDFVTRVFGSAEDGGTDSPGYCLIVFSAALRADAPPGRINNQRSNEYPSRRTSGSLPL